MVLAPVCSKQTGRGTVRITPHTIAAACVGQKDLTKGLFDIWDSVFTLHEKRGAKRVLAHAGERCSSPCGLEAHTHSWLSQALTAARTRGTGLPQNSAHSTCGDHTTRSLLLLCLSRHPALRHVLFAVTHKCCGQVSITTSLAAATETH